MLINNSGIAPRDDLGDRTIIERALAVNFFGMYRVSRAFLPLLKRSKGAIVNNLSLMALAPPPLTPSYAISKVAALSMTQSLSALLASQDVTVHGVFLGPVDTHMTRRLEIPKASTEAVGGRHLRRIGERRRGHLPRSRCPARSLVAGAMA